MGGAWIFSSLEKYEVGLGKYDRRDLVLFWVIYGWVCVDLKFFLFFKEVVGVWGVWGVGECLE